MYEVRTRTVSTATVTAWNGNSGMPPPLEELVVEVDCEVVLVVGGWEVELVETCEVEAIVVGVEVEDVVGRVLVEDCDVD